MNNQPELTLEHFHEGLVKRTPGETEFHQAVLEFAEFVIPYINANPKYLESQNIRTNDGTRPHHHFSGRVGGRCRRQFMSIEGIAIQFNNSIGPYKGGLRFHHSVNLEYSKVSRI